MGALVRYDAACRAIAEAKRLDEVKDFRDKAVAMAAYARQANNRDLEVDAIEIRWRAEQRLGEMLAEGEKARAGRPPENWCPDGTDFRGAPTLSALGIDKKLSARAQKMAAIPKEEFNGIIGEWRERIGVENERVTTNFLRAAARAEDRMEYETEIARVCEVSDLQALADSGKKFGAIYADPPWLYDNQGTRAATGNHYNGMTIEQLCALPVQGLVADDAHLHLWTTNGFLFEAPKIFAAWGFEFRSSLIWCKPQMGIGNYWRNSHEILLTAIRGDAKRFNDKSLKSWIECDRGAHSDKPDQVRSFIERASNGPYLELFARRPAQGWTVWGNQIERSLFSSQVAA